MKNFKDSTTLRRYLEKTLLIGKNQIDEISNQIHDRKVRFKDSRGNQYKIYGHNQEYVGGTRKYHLALEKSPKPIKLPYTKKKK